MAYSSQDACRQKATVGESRKHGETQGLSTIAAARFGLTIVLVLLDGWFVRWWGIYRVSGVIKGEHKSAHSCQSFERIASELTADTPAAKRHSNAAQTALDRRDRYLPFGSCGSVVKKTQMASRAGSIQSAVPVAPQCP